jgi:hypothetical protein
MNLKNYKDLWKLDKFIDASRAAAKEDGWVLVIYPTIFLGEERFQYYYVVPNRRIITWLENLDGTILFSECYKPSQWRHKSMCILNYFVCELNHAGLELEAQYW